MRSDKEAALKLRLSGKSYREINILLHVPKSTLSGWLSDVIISQELKVKIEERAHKKSIEGLIKRNKNQTFLAIKRASETRNKAALEIKTLSKSELLHLGIALYWAEGYKRSIVRNGRELTHHPVSLTNSDPALVKLFLKFLREYCAIPENKIKASVRLFPHQNEKELLSFWRKETGIAKENFGKTYYGISKSSTGKRPYNRLPYGIIQIVVADTQLFHRIMGYIEGIKEMM